MDIATTSGTSFATDPRGGQEGGDTQGQHHCDRLPSPSCSSYVCTNLMCFREASPPPGTCTTAWTASCSTPPPPGPGASTSPSWSTGGGRAWPSTYRGGSRRNSTGEDSPSCLEPLHQESCKDGRELGQGTCVHPTLQHHLVLRHLPPQLRHGRSHLTPQGFQTEVPGHQRFIPHLGHES